MRFRGLETMLLEKNYQDILFDIFTIKTNIYYLNDVELRLIENRGLYDLKLQL